MLELFKYNKKLPQSWANYLFVSYPLQSFMESKMQCSFSQATPEQFKTITHIEIIKILFTFTDLSYSPSPIFQYPTSENVLIEFIMKKILLNHSACVNY